MNYIEKEDQSFKGFIKDALTIRFWIYMLTAVFLILSTTSIANSITALIIDKTILSETIKGIFKFAAQIPLAFLVGRYIVANILRILFSNKLLSDFPINSKLLFITNFLYSRKIQKEVFLPIAADWLEEYFEALFKKEIWKARWINVRYTSAFLAAMWQKSPIGDLIEFISKLAK